MGKVLFKAARFAPRIRYFAEKLLVFCATRFKGVNSNYAHPIPFVSVPFCSSGRRHRFRGKTDTRAESGPDRQTCANHLQAGGRSNRADHHLLLSPFSGQGALPRHRNHAGGIRSGNEGTERSRHYCDQLTGSARLEARREKHSAAVRRDYVRRRLEISI